MAGTHEEQLLSHWLRDIARQDERLRADHLETRIAAAASDSSTAQWRARSHASRWAVAAVVALAVAAPAFFWTDEDIARQTAESTPTATEDTVNEKPVATVADEPKVAVQPAPVRRRHAASLPASVQRVVTSESASDLPLNPSQDEFVPLMPMTPQELTGPFQIVRVQMPRASLGALRLPLDHPSELVEADVLLGEDGMARAIRVSTGGSIYPWRSR